MESPWIRTTSMETFRADVMEQSMECPVVVDFWAEWCQPCQQLMPILEKLAVDFDGRFILVKINVDELPELAGAFGVQSVPFVMALDQGQPVSQLPGAQPEPQVKAWLESFLPSPANEAWQAGLQAEGSGDLESAETSFRTAADLDSDNAEYQIGLARVLMQLDRDIESSEIVAKLEERGFLEPEAERLKEQLELRTNVEESGGVAAAREALNTDPGSIELQLKLAEALSTDRRYTDACDILLEIIAQDRTYLRERAKDAMVTMLTAMGPKSTQAADYRRKLATAFY